MSFDEDSIAFLGGIIIGFIGGTILFLVMSVKDFNKNLTSLQKRAIEMNYGEYNSKTGAFEWIDKNVQKLIEGEKK